MDESLNELTVKLMATDRCLDIFYTLGRYRVRNHVSGIRRVTRS